MSVPQYKRSENQLEVLNIAIEVFQLIISLTKNEYVIPKKNYKYIAEPLLNTIRNLMYKISIANNLSTKKLEQLKQRYEEQIEARKS